VDELFIFHIKTCFQTQPQRGDALGCRRSGKEAECRNIKLLAYKMPCYKFPAAKTGYL